jgi:spermidine synthase
MEGSLRIIGVVYVAAGIGVIMRLGEFRRHGARMATASGVVALTAAILVAVPRMDKKALTSGVYRYAPIYETVDGLRANMRRVSILFYDEGIDATVSVEKFRGETSILIDGKADASSGIEDMRTQVLLAQLPLLLHADPDTVLVIGLGSGVTLGSAETHDVRLIECVELLDNVVEASGYMREYNLDCLADPRAELIVGDGRNHLQLSTRKYDVIISEPTNPWISGVGDLFTREFFGLARERLNPGGIMCEWFHTYHMGAEDVRCMIATFMSVFPNVYLWLVNDGDIILLGSPEPLTLGEHIKGRMLTAPIAEDLGRIWIRSLPDLASFFVAGPGALAGFTGPVRELNTDDNMMLEFSAGLKVFESTEAIHISGFLDLIESPPTVGNGNLDAEDMRRRTRARKLALESVVEVKSRGADAAVPLLEEAYSLSPTDPYVIHKFVENRLILGHALYAAGDFEGARGNYLAALVEPDYPLAWRAYLGLGTSQAAGGEWDAARTSYMRSIQRNPDNPKAYHNLGKLERVVGNMDAAVVALKRSFEIEPEAGVASDLSRVYLELGINLETAADLAEQAVAWEAAPAHYITLGWALNRLGEYRRGEDALVKAIELDPGNTEAMWGLAAMRLSRGDIQGARTVLRELVTLGKDDAYSRRARKKLAELEG